MDAVLNVISDEHRSPLPLLKDLYADVLRETTASAFTDGKTSFDYRRKRFSLLLARLSLQADVNYMQELLDLYENTLMDSLKFKDGALSLMLTLKVMSKKIVVITEGPQDAQERTVQRLRIDTYIDFLATTNFFKVSKTDGLFPRVLKHLGISAENMAYIGDNEQRDIQPAIAEGILAIHLSEGGIVSLDAAPPRIQTLKQLQYIISA